MPPRSADSPAAPAAILLVDDNRHGLLARRSILQEIGYEAVVAHDPLEALQAAGERSFDLIVTDYRMPHMTGVELIAELRARSIMVPVILISGFVDTLGLTEAGTGADAVIQKSQNEVQQLLRTVTRLLRKKAPKKPPASASAPPPRSRAKGSN